MRIDLTPADAWTAVADQYRAVLANQLPVFAESALVVQTYMGYEHALWEVTQGLAKLFSHKKTIAIVAGAEPSFESIAVAFSAEGYTVKTISATELTAPAAWLEPIATDLLFLLYSIDDPATGRLFHADVLFAALKDKRAFRIGVSHAAHRLPALERPQPLDVRILSLSRERALVLGGERCKVQPPVVSRLPWLPLPEEIIEQDLSRCSNEEAGLLQKTILAFEQDLPEGFKAYFAENDLRVFDRAAIFNPEFDGSAVIELLAASLGQTLTAPGAAGALESTSPCRWNNPRIAEWLLRRGESEDVIRGLVLISAETLTAVGESRLRDALAQVSRELRRMQTGE